MPELPEVETIRLQLNSVLTGLKITGVQVLTAKSFQGKQSEIIGKKIIQVFRRAKITIIQLESNIFFAIHLKLTGQLIYRERNEKGSKYCEQKDGPFAVCRLPNKYTRVIISFNNGGKLYFNDLRIFGWIKTLKSLSELSVKNFGPEADDEKTFSLGYFKKILGKSGKPVKLVIMDQEKLAGIGNIYANEALFAARILPTRKADSLSDKEISKLRLSIIKVLKDAIKHKGSSDKDEAYRQASGEKGTHQDYLQVYGKTGRKCTSCKGLIKRITVGGRGTFYCPSCQK